DEHAWGAPEGRDDLDAAGGLEQDAPPVRGPEGESLTALLPHDLDRCASVHLADEEPRLPGGARDVRNELPVRRQGRVDLEAGVESHLSAAPELEDCGTPPQQHGAGYAEDDQHPTATAARPRHGSRFASAGASRMPVGVVPPLGVASGSSWASSSSAVCHRSAGRFSRHFMMIAASAGGHAGRHLVTGSGACETCAASTSWVVPAVNG